MIGLVLSLALAIPEQQIAAFDISGVGEIQLRMKLYEEIESQLILKSKKQGSWVLRSEELRLRLQSVEEQVACEDKCELQLSKAALIDEIILSELELKSTEKGKMFRLNMTSFDVATQKQLRNVSSAFLEEHTLLSRIPVLVGALLGSEEPSADSDTVIMTIRSQPTEAVVLVDQNIVCMETPCSFPIPKGEHSLSVQKEDHLPFVFKGDIQADQTMRIQLEPTFALVDISSADKGNLYLNGRPIPTPPIFSYKISEGSHLLTVNDRCLQRLDKQIDILPAETKSIHLETKKRTVPVDIRALDSFGVNQEVMILVDGVEIGQSPFVGKIPICTKEISIRRTDSSGEQYVEKRAVYLQPKENKIVLSVEDEFNAGQRSVPFSLASIMDSPLWYASVGFKSSLHNANDDARFQLSSGYIQPISASFQSGIYSYSVPSNLYLSDRVLDGFGGGVMLNNHHLYARFDIDYTLSGELLYYAPLEGEGFPLMLYAPDHTNFALSFGVMPMFAFIRPFAGLRVQGGVYSIDILEVPIDSEFLSSFELNPYYLVSTDFDDDGSPVRPRLVMGQLGIGPSVGGLPYFPGADFLLGAEFQYSYVLTTAGNLSQTDFSVVFGNRFD